MRIIIILTIVSLTVRARSPLSSLVRCLLVLYTGDAKLAVVCWSAVGVGGLQQRRPLRAVSHWRPALSRLLEATLSQALSEASPGREGRVAAGRHSPCLQSYAARCAGLLRHGHVAPRGPRGSWRRRSAAALVGRRGRDRGARPQLRRRGASSRGSSGMKLRPLLLSLSLSLPGGSRACFSLSASRSAARSEHRGRHSVVLVAGLRHAAASCSRSSAAAERSAA